MDNIEFDPLDLDEGFVAIPGKPREITHKVLTDTLDHDAKTGMHASSARRCRIPVLWTVRPPLLGRVDHYSG